MIILDATTKSLQVLLGGAVATTELQICVSYADVNTTTFAVAGIAEGDTATTGVTPVTVVAAPGASTSRKISLLTVYNADTTSATVTVQVNNNATLRTLVKVILAVGSTLQYTDGGGWAVITTTGQRLTGLGAPGDAQYLVGATDSTLTAERVVTDTTSITWDLATAGQAKASRAALTGDVTASANANATTIANDAVTYAKMQNVSAASRLLGRGSAGGAGDPEEITLGTGLAMTGTSLSSTATGGSPTVQTTTLTGTQADFSLSAGFTYLRCNNASALVFSGFSVGGATPTDGDRVIIDNIGSSTVQVTTQDVGSTAAYRVICPSTAGQIIGANGRMECVYDATTGRWREALVNAGAPVQIAFAAGDFTGNNSMTWTVASGDVRVLRYVQQGKLLVLMFGIVASSVGGTPSTVLSFAFTTATGFTITTTTDAIGWALDNGSQLAARVTANATTGLVNFSRTDGANWSASTDLTNCTANVPFEVT